MNFNSLETFNKSEERLAKIAVMKTELIKYSQDIRYNIGNIW